MKNWTTNWTYSLFLYSLYSCDSLIISLLMKWKLNITYFYRVIRRIAAAAKSLQSCPTLWDPTDGSPPGSPVPGIFQAKTLEWVAISFSNAWKWKVKEKWLSPVPLLATPWTTAYQAPLSVGFSRQEYWSGVPLPSLSNTIGIFKVGKLKNIEWNTYNSVSIGTNRHIAH